MMLQRNLVTHSCLFMGGWSYCFWTASCLLSDTSFTSYLTHCSYLFISVYQLFIYCSKLTSTTCSCCPSCPLSSSMLETSQRRVVCRAMVSSTMLQTAQESSSSSSLFWWGRWWLWWPIGHPPCTLCLCCWTHILQTVPALLWQGLVAHSLWGRDKGTQSQWHLGDHQITSWEACYWPQMVYEGEAQCW